MKSLTLLKSNILINEWRTNGAYSFKYWRIGLSGNDESQRK